MLVASSSLYAAQVTHIYDLNGSLSDSFGGPALVAAGGTLNPTNYSFGPNQGLALSDGLVNPADYSIEVIFNFSAVSSWRKIIDLKDRTADSGLYNKDTAMQFYSVVIGPSGVFSANVNVHLVMTRDASTKAFVGYLDGVQQISFNDGSDLAVFSETNNIIHFFKDDFTTSTGEASAGVVDLIRIYDGVLSQSDVVDLFNGVSPLDVAPPATLLEPPTEEILTFTGESSSFGLVDLHSGLTGAGDEIALEFTAPSGNASRKLQAIRYYIHSGPSQDVMVRGKVYMTGSQEPGTLLREITQTIPASLTGFTPFQKGSADLSLDAGTTFYIALGYITAESLNLGVAGGVNPLLQTKQFVYDGSSWRTAQQAGVLANQCVMIEGIWGIKGDLDDSGTVNLADAIRTVDFVLGRGGALSDFEAFEADLDNNEEMNMGDVVQIIDVFLGGP